MTAAFGTPGILDIWPDKVATQNIQGIALIAINPPVVLMADSWSRYCFVTCSAVRVGAGEARTRPSDEKEKHGKGPT